VDICASQNMNEGYESAHAILFLESVAVIIKRTELKAKGHLMLLPEPSQTVADRSYIDTALRLYEGFEKIMNVYKETSDLRQKRIYEIWAKS
jgi:hypothetical protein